MKNILKLLSIGVVVAVGMLSCKKVADLPLYQSGVAPELSSSVYVIAPKPADSMTTALSLFWTNPKYATDSSTCKYIIEIDSSGRNFSHEATKVVVGALSTSFIAKDLNNILLGFGFIYNKTYDVDVRITSSYGNNNNQLQSNVLKLKMTPYVVPPKVVPPSSKALFLVGSATAGGWGNPVPLPAQQFKKLDSVTYQGTFFMNGGQQYLMLPVNGDWSHKYAVADNSIAGLNAGGDFGYDLSSNFPGPATTGTYTILVDFQHGKFTVTKVSQYDLLYVPGDYQGWDPTKAGAIGSPKKDGNYEGYVNIPSGGSYEFKLTSVPSWSGTAYGDGGGGTLSTSGGNLTVPAGGYYFLNASTGANTWSALATTWGLIGDFNGWATDVLMTYDAGSNSWSGTITAAAAGGFKFRANAGWSLNYGDTGADGSLEQGGDNIGITAGTHTITLYLGNPGYYTYNIK